MALDFAMDVLVGINLKHTNRPWLKQQLSRYFKGLYTLYLPFPGTTYSRAQAAKAQIVAALMKELQDPVQEITQAEPEASAAADTVTMLRRVDAAGKCALMQTRQEFQMDPARLSSSMNRLKDKDSSSGVSLADAQFEYLRSQQRLTLESAADLILQMFLAAVDTTRPLIFNTLAMLAQLPEEVYKLREEQQQVRGRQPAVCAPYLLHLLVESAMPTNSCDPHVYATTAAGDVLSWAPADPCCVVRIGVS